MIHLNNCVTVLMLPLQSFLGLFELFFIGANTLDGSVVQRRPIECRYVASVVSGFYFFEPRTSISGAIVGKSLFL